MRAGPLLGLVTLSAALWGCQRQPNHPPTPPDATDAVAPPPVPVDASLDGDPSDGCDFACAALLGAGCLLGGQPSCSSVFRRDLGTGKVENATTHKPLTCDDIAKVKTRLDAQKLGFVCAP